MASRSDKEFLIRVRADIRQAVRDLERIKRELVRTGAVSRKQTRKQASELENLRKKLRFLTRAGGAWIALNMARKQLELADAYAVLQTRIRTATKATGDYNKVSAELAAISDRNGVALQTTVELYQNLARSAPELGATTDQTLALVNAVQQLGIISGAAPANLSAGLLQFSQGLASGVFRAEEFNSLLENIPEVANRIAQGMGKTVGELRQGIIKGEVLSKDVFDALLKQAPDIAKEFAGIPDTMGRAGEALDNAWSRFLGRLDKAIGGTSTLARLMRSIADVLDSGPPKPTPKRSPTAIARADLDAAVAKLKQARLDLRDTLAGGATDAERAFNRVFQSEEARLKKIEQARTRVAAASLFVSARARRLRDAAFFEQDRPAKSSTGQTPKPVTPPKPSKEEQARIDRINKTIRALQTEAAVFGLSERQAALYQLQIDGATAAQIDLADRALSAKAAMQQQADSMARAKEIIDQTRTAEEQLLARLDELQSLQDQGLIDQETVQRAMQQTAEQFKTLGDSGNQVFDELIQASHGWARDFADTLLSGERSFAGFVDAVLREIERIALAKAFEPFFGQVGTFFGKMFGEPTKNASGGLISGPGGPTDDRIPAMLSNGEYVVRAQAVSHYGRRFLDDINAIRRPRFATGGFVGFRPALALAGGGAVQSRGGGPVEVRIDNRGQPQAIREASASLEADRLVVDVVLEDLNRGGPVSGALSRTFGLRRSGV